MQECDRMVAGGGLLEVHTWKGLLELCGIEVELKGEALLGGIGELPTGLHNVELWVPASQYAQAKAQLESLNTNGPQWQCLQCHEINENSFELCWQCSTERCI